MKKIYKTSLQDIEEARKEVLASSLKEDTKTILARIITGYLYLIKLLDLLFGSDRSQQRKSRKELKEFVDANEKSKKKKKSPDKSDKGNEESRSNENSTSGSNNEESPLGPFS